MESLKELGELLKSFHIESRELTQALAAMEKLMTLSETHRTAMAEIARKFQAMQAAVHVPNFVLPAPDPEVQKQLAHVQAVVAETFRSREWWEKDLDGALIQ